MFTITACRRCGEMADATDLKSVLAKARYGFESHHRHQRRSLFARVNSICNQVHGWARSWIVKERTQTDIWLATIHSLSLVRKAVIDDSSIFVLLREVFRGNLSHGVG